MKDVNAAVTKMFQQLMKYKLPDNSTVDFSSDVIEEIREWIQVAPDSREAGGFLVGYQNRITSNMIVDGASHPYCDDYRTRIRFDIKDNRHQQFLSEQERDNSYYVGTWHTHPEEVPCPSSRDLKDWKTSLRDDMIICRWMLFIIAGTKSMRIWVGDTNKYNITEIFECEKQDGLYVDKTERNTIL